MTKLFTGFVAVIATTLILVIGGISIVYGKRLLETRKNESQARKVELFPKPRLENEPRVELAQLRLKEKEILTTYGRENGKIRVPVERAMEEMTK